MTDIPNFFETFERISSPGRVFYHGSRGGIIGPIRPMGRPATDFGTGFYIGTDSFQTKGLVVNDAQPMAYALTIDFTGIDESDVLVLDRLDWVYTVLHNRRNCIPFNGSQLDLDIASLADGYDFVIGPIADDRMNTAVRAFAENSLTDEGLYACLARVPYGTQIVAKTERACARINIVASDPIYDSEADDISRYNAMQRDAARVEFDKVKVGFKGRGKLLSELIAEHQPVDISAPANKAVLMFGHDLQTSTNEIQQ